MARLHNGILGGVLGTIGNIEGYMSRGQFIYRSKRTKSTKPPTEKQLAARQKMKLVKHFVGVFTDFVRVGFAYTAIGKKYSAYDAAVGWQLKNAIAGEYPNQSINYAAVQVSIGPIDLKDLHVQVQLSDDKLIFSWQPDHTYLHASERVMLLAYDAASNEAVYVRCGARRSAGTDSLVLPGDMLGKGIAVETWLSFVEENGVKCGNSIYTGRFKL